MPCDVWWGFSEGDSGGPILLTDRRNKSLAAGNPEMDLILGVISMGKDCRQDKTEASAHTDVSSFFQWINETISTGTCISQVIYLLYSIF